VLRKFKYSSIARIRKNLSTYFTFLITTSSGTSATATENFVYSNLLVIPALKISTWEKKIKSHWLHFRFPFLMDLENKVIYGLYRRNMSIHYN